MSNLTCADLIQKVLTHFGIEQVFSVLGSTVDTLASVFASDSRYIVSNSEQSAVLMADGYYREKGKISAVCVATGSSTTNMLEGLKHSLVEEIPLLVITVSKDISTLGCETYQDICLSSTTDIVGMFDYCTKSSTLVSHRDQLEHKLIAAIRKANENAKGPVHLSIPRDFLVETCQQTISLSKQLIQPYTAAHDYTVVNKLFGNLNGAVAMYLGSGISKSQREIMRFIELTNTPFVVDAISKGHINEHHPYYNGVYGSHNLAGQLFHNDSIDTVLIVGRCSAQFGRGYKEALSHKKIIHIADVQQHFVSSESDQCILCDLSYFFCELSKRIDIKRIQSLNRPVINGIVKGKGLFNDINLGDGLNDRAEACSISPSTLMSFLSKKLPPDARVFVGGNKARKWAVHDYLTENSRGYCRIALSCSPTNWPVHAAIGSSLADVSVSTLCIIDDVSSLLSYSDISVAIQKNLPIVFLFLDDMVAGAPNFSHSEIAYKLGIEYSSIKTLMQLSSMSIDFLFKAGGPVLLGVYLNQDGYIEHKKTKSIACDG